MSDASVVEISGLSKTFRVPRRKQTRALDTNTLNGIIALVRQGFRANASGANDEKFVRLVHALSDINLAVDAGEVLGVIGRNGAGKSTLLKILAKVIDPSSGHVRITGRVVSLLELGIGFDPDFTVRENIYLNGQLAGMSLRAIMAAEDSILEFAELTEYRNSPLYRCPGGSFVRLAFATMMGIRSDIILADEVLAVGDAKFRASCEERMRNVARTGEAVLFVSHDMEAVRRVCTRVAWIDGGRIRQVGDPEVVIRAYLSDLLQGRLLDHRVGDGALAESGSLVDLRLASNPGMPIGALQMKERGFIEGLVRIATSGIAARLHLEVRQGKHAVFCVTSPWTQHSLGPANHSIAVEIPPHFLNEGVYTALATLELIGKDPGKTTMSRAPLDFPVMNTSNADSVWSGWGWSRPGLISPRIIWTSPRDPD